MMRQPFSIFNHSVFKHFLLSECLSSLINFYPEVNKSFFSVKAIKVSILISVVVDNIQARKCDQSNMLENMRNGHE